MHRFTVDQKLKLVEQLHSQYNKNQYDLSNRERILYGKTSEKDYFERFPENPQEEIPILNTFRIRVMLALVLAVGLIFLDRNQGSIAGLSSGKIFDAISADYEEDLNTWLEAEMQSTQQTQTGQTQR